MLVDFCVIFVIYKYFKSISSGTKIRDVVLANCFLYICINILVNSYFKLSDKNAKVLRFTIKTIHSLMVNYQRRFCSTTVELLCNPQIVFSDGKIVPVSRLQTMRFFSQCARRKFYIQVVLLDKLQLCLYLK